MNLLKGQRVRSVPHPDWSLGELLEECNGEKARVLFERLGERVVSSMTLELVEGADAQSDRLDRLKARLRISHRAEHTQHLSSVSRDHFSPTPQEIQLGRTLGADFSKVFHYCEQFYFEMHDNRPNCDDGSLALNVVADLRRQGILSRTTTQQLAAWCTTNGTAYQRGVPIAHNISFALFGRVLRREE